MQIVAVLNSHHESLAWLDDRSSALRREVALLRKDLSLAAATSERK